MTCDQRTGCVMPRGKKLEGIIVTSRMIKEVLQLDVNSLPLRLTSDVAGKATDDMLSNVNRAPTAIVSGPAAPNTELPDLVIVGLRSDGRPIVTPRHYRCSFLQANYSCH